MHKTKYRKYHKSLSYYKSNSVATSGVSIANIGPTPIYGIVTRETATLTEKQIETARRTLARALKTSKGRYWIRVYPDIPVTAKPAEVRMGKGKGSVSYWGTRAKIGKVLFEFEVGGAHNILQAQLIRNSLSNKLGIPSLALLTNS